MKAHLKSVPSRNRNDIANLLPGLKPGHTVRGISKDIGEGARSISLAVLA